MGYTDKQVKNVQAGGVSDSYIQEQITNNPTVASKVTMDEVNTQVNELLVDSGIDEFKDNYGGIIDTTENYEKVDGIFVYWNGIDIIFGESNIYEYIVIDVTKKRDIYITANGNKNSRLGLYFNGEPFDKTTYIGCEDIEYDENISNSKSFVDYKLTIPSEAKYVLINNRKPSGELRIKEYSNGYVAKKVKEMPINLYKDKNILLLGDSITQLGMGERGWVRYFSQKTYPKRVDNVAVIGARMRDRTNTVYDGNPLFNGEDSNENNVIGNQVQKIINNRSDYLDDYDFIFICAGTNDYNNVHELTYTEVDSAYYNGTELKALEDVDRHTWAGATRYIVEKLRELFPSAIIVFNTPINRIDDNSCRRIFEHTEIIRKCSEITSTLLCDVNHCGIVMYDDTDFNNDGLHPSIQGAKKIGNYVADWFIEYCNAHYN